MTKLFSLISILLSCNLQAQITLNPGVVSKGRDVEQILDLFNEYYSLARSDSLNKAKELWYSKDTADFTNPDMNFYRINTSVPLFKQGYPNIMGITHYNDTIFQLKLMIGWGDTLHRPYALAIINYYITNFGSEYKLINKFRVTPKIIYKSIGNTSFLYTSATINIDSIASTVHNKYTKLHKIFPNIKNDRKTIVMGESESDVNYILGNDFTIFDALNNPSSGITQVDNQLAICSNVVVIEHELTHLWINRLGVNSKLLEGFATYFGGHFGRSYEFHLNKMKATLDIDTIDFYTKLIDEYFYIDNTYNPNYIVQAIIVNYVFKNYGDEGLQKLLDIDNWKYLFLYVFKTENIDEINAKIRNLINSV